MLIGWKGNLKSSCLKESRIFPRMADSFCGLGTTTSSTTLCTGGIRGTPRQSPHYIILSNRPNYLWQVTLVPCSLRVDHRGSDPLRPMASELKPSGGGGPPPPACETANSSEITPGIYRRLFFFFFSFLFSHDAYGCFVACLCSFRGYRTYRIGRMVYFSGLLSCRLIV